jgi:hypothetical protein
MLGEKKEGRRHTIRFIYTLSGQVSGCSRILLVAIYEEREKEKEYIYLDNLLCVWGALYRRLWVI